MLMVMGVVGGVAGLPSPVAAESGAVSDETGGRGPRWDITRLQVDNGEHRVTMRVRVRDLGPVGLFRFHYHRAADPYGGRNLRIEVQRERVGEPLQHRVYRCRGESCDLVRCPSLRVRWRARREVVVASVRQDCFPKPRRDPGAEAPRRGAFDAIASQSEFSDDPDGIDQLLVLDRG